MTLVRIYHTERRGYIVADTFDLGAKLPPELAASGDELLQRETLPRQPRPQVRKAPGPNQVIVLAACRQAPGTVAELAERTGLAMYSVQQALSERLFTPVGMKVLHGRRRIVYGVKE